jgi:penicillin-binding protein 2
VDLITWFASFAPFDNPRYVVLVMVESGSSGTKSCAPIAGKIYETIRDLERSQRPAKSSPLVADVK